MNLEAALHARGKRVTRARTAVWDVLVDTGEHLSAPAITSQVHDIDPAINASSVYRALSLFTDLGLVRESRLDDTTMWELFHDDAAIHLICSACGKVVHHDTELVHRLRATLDRREDFVPAEIDVRVAGSCVDCKGLSQTT